MARDFTLKPYPPFDGSVPLDVYRARMARDYGLQRAEFLRQGRMGQARDENGKLLYLITDRGECRRTRDIPKRTRAAVLARDGHACVNCGATRSLELDHIVRYIDGGSDEPDNLRTLCQPCHAKRGGRP
ncbi:HNH endonuclease [Occultella gossypii]|uniref:HNH endonuclease n=1 Tax=Occultella gossypii TaxID=2800820 RepID=A0ABS7SDC0_9MICO|nr:HNH endonuclease [Occultella gossypii]MBZ2197258.1 HNH endonuclease [Occultella gossypii]